MANFWQQKSLKDMTQDEWESLCDGCARCCMIKLQDDETEAVHYTGMVCDLLQLSDCRCSDYPNRHVRVPDCVVLTPERASNFAWLPVSCAYRTLAEGRDLAWWHPLVSGDEASVVAAGISVLDRVVPQASVHASEHEEMLITWVET